MLNRNSISPEQKMKGVTLLLVFYIFGATGYLFKVSPPGSNLSPSTLWLHKQKSIITLFQNVCGTSLDPAVTQYNNDFIETDYTKADVVDNFKNLLNKGLLPKGTIFTEFDSIHQYEFKTIFELLYYAKDFDTFYKTAVWARQNINCGVYIDAIYLSVIKRTDMTGILVPAPYEVLPNYFIQKDVIIKAESLLRGQDIEPSDNIKHEGNSYTISVDDNNDKSLLSYFYEDMSLNTYYYFKKLEQTLMFKQLLQNDIYGEHLYHVMKQMAVRYNLERYANQLPAIDSINWVDSYVTPYDPDLMYSNGEDFAHRTESFNTYDIAKDNSVVDMLKSIEQNVIQVMSSKIQSGFNKTQILNSMMEVLVTGDNSYENMARTLFGQDFDKNEGHFSVLEHYMTTLRDPLFWKINEKIVNMVDTVMSNLPPYADNELYFPGVEIFNVEMKKIMTNFECFEMDVSDSLTNEKDSYFDVKLSQARLNHKPFAIKLNFTSLSTTRGFVKIFMGPKMLPGEFISNKNKFMLIDSFQMAIKNGANVLTRSSDNMVHLSEDFMSLKKLKKIVQDAEYGLDVFSQLSSQMLLRFPNRMIIPKGLASGLPLQIIVVIAPLVKVMKDSTFTEFNTALMSPGFPFDQKFDERLFSFPNVFVKDVMVTHKDECQMVTPHLDTELTNDMNNKPFDYAARNGQYFQPNYYEFDPTNTYISQPIVENSSFIVNKKLKTQQKNDKKASKTFSKYNEPKEKVEVPDQSYEQKILNNIDYVVLPVNKQFDLNENVRTLRYAEQKTYDYKKTKEDYAAKRNKYIKNKKDDLEQNENQTQETITLTTKTDDIDSSETLSHEQIDIPKSNLIDNVPTLYELILQPFYMNQNEEYEKSYE